ncbi:MAG: hypothetical protein SFY92_12380 [Verrucomicrobiae bacterium]|nr:hypothetical protein [Verrucomicrobiae bacterium]
MQDLLGIGTGEKFAGLAEHLDSLKQERIALTDLLPTLLRALG